MLCKYQIFIVYPVKKLTKNIILSDNGEFSDGFANDGFRSQTPMGNAQRTPGMDFYLLRKC